MCVCGAGGTRSPVIIMSEELNSEGHGGVGVGVGAYTRDEHSSCMPRLVVPGMTPRSSVSSQSCLSVPSNADFNGYRSLHHAVRSSSSRPANAAITAATRLRFDCNSTALPPFDDLRYDRKPISMCGLLHCGLRLAGYVTVTLMTFDKQSNGRRIEVKS